MMRFIAHIISSLFHPLLMATFCCVLLFFGLTDTIYFVFTPIRIKLVLIITVFSFTFLLPLLNLLVLYKLNYVSSLYLTNRRERALPLIITAMCYFGLYYLIQDFSIWPAIKLLILGGGVSIMCAGIISIKWQISTHMIGIGGLIGVLLAICYFMQLPILLPIALLIVLAGFIGTARLQLNAHTPAQVYVGFLVGCTIQFVLFFVAQMLIFI